MPSLKLYVSSNLLALFAVMALSGGAPLCAQQTQQQIVVSNDALQLLLKRIDQLEARVKQLETEKQQASTTIPSPDKSASNAPQPLPGSLLAPVPEPPDGSLPGMDGPPVADTPLQAAAAPAQPASPATADSRAAALQNAVAQTSSPSTSSDPEQNQSDNSMMERMDVSRTLLRIRGFGDISFHGDTQKGDTTSFSLGQLDLFVTSDVSDKFKFLSEIVFEAGPTNVYGTNIGDPNSFGVDIERYLLQYSHNDYFNISVGRVHTAIGYYNTAYHHSSWLQTTTGRPFLFDFEDKGGILPIHTVGASVSGQVPSGSLGLHYVAEIGNGRASRTPLTEEPVQNEIDDQNHKAYNLAVFARPEAHSRAANRVLVLSRPAGSAQPAADRRVDPGRARRPDPAEIRVA